MNIMKSNRLLLFISLLLLLFLVGCNSFSGIRKDFENAGYTYSEETNNIIASLLEEFEEEDVEVTGHSFSKGLNAAFVLEFKSSQELEDRLSESATLQGLVEDLQKSDFVRGNCLLIPIGLNPQEMIDVFQGK